MYTISLLGRGNKMRKREFLRKLNSRLSHLDRSEREDILDYYDELIEDSIDRTGKTEAEVIYDLGELDDIVRRVDPYHRSKMRYDEFEEEKEKQVDRKRDVPRRKEKSGNAASSLWRTLLTILKVIFFIALTIACFVVFISGIGIFFGGIYMIIVSALNFDDGFTITLFRIGVGIGMMGGTCIVIPLILKILSWIWKVIRSFLNALSGKKRRNYAYEN